MDALPYWLWGLFVFVVFMTLLGAAVASAYSHVQVEHLAGNHERKDARLDRAIALLQKRGLPTVLQLNHSLWLFVLAVFVVSLLKDFFHLRTFLQVLGISLLVLLVFFVLQALVERAVLADAEKAALKLLPVAGLIRAVYSPITALMLALMGSQAEKDNLSLTDEDLRDWLNQDEEDSQLEKDERQMIYSIFQFGDTMAKDVMIPRMDVLALEINTSISDARKAFIKAGHSRVPVYDDNFDDVVGLLYAKDLLAVVDGNDSIAQQRHLLRPAAFVPEAKKVDELLAEMKSKGIHMTLVVDEYGGVAGVVTLEDIVEEIVGEIRDEYDGSEERLYEQKNTNEWVFLGRVTIDEFNELTGSQLEDDFADTLGGYIYGLLGRVPQAGEIIKGSGVEFKVEEVQARRIIKVKATFPPSEAKDHDKE